MSDIGVGLIGYGLGGRVFHAPFVTTTPGMQLRAVVSSDPHKVHLDYPYVHVVPDVDALLALPDLDLVIVCSPDELHAEHALAAVAAGKHVLVDKPFATRLDDARRVAAAAAHAGVLLTVFQNRRWDADFLTLRRMVAEGRLGRIVHFESHFDRWRPDVPPIWKESRRGGSWFDLGPHLVDQVLCLFGRPNAVTADLATIRENAPAPDWFHVVLRYDRCRAILHSSKLTVDHGLRFAVHGSGGSWVKHGLDVQEPAIIAGSIPTDIGFGRDPRPGLYTPASDPATSSHVVNEPGGYASFWLDLERAIRGQGTNPVPAKQAIDVIEILELAIASAETGKTISVATATLR